MNQEEHFLEAISASEPNADLIYADWLEEQGRPEADEIRSDSFSFSPFLISLFGSSVHSSFSKSCNSWDRSRSGNFYRSLSQSRYRLFSLCRSQTAYATVLWSRIRSKSKCGCRYG